MNQDTKNILWRAAELVEAYEERFAHLPSLTDKGKGPVLFGPLDEAVEALRDALRARRDARRNKK